MTYKDEADAIDAAHAAYRSAQERADRAVWPEATAARAEAEAAYDAWQAMERTPFVERAGEDRSLIGPWTAAPMFETVAIGSYDAETDELTTVPMVSPEILREMRGWLTDAGMDAIDAARLDEPVVLTTVAGSYEGGIAAFVRDAARTTYEDAETELTDSPTTVKVRLWGWDETINDSIRALLFGELIKRAAPIVQHYQSDLFHDAAWVAKWVNGPMTFWFVARDWGTHIGTDEGEAVHHLPAVLNASRGDETMRAWSVELERVGGEWFAVITDMSTVPA